MLHTVIYFTHNLICEFELPDVSLRCFVMRQLLWCIYALSSVNFQASNCGCVKKVTNMKYAFGCNLYSYIFLYLYPYLELYPPSSAGHEIFKQFSPTWYLTHLIQTKLSWHISAHVGLSLFSSCFSRDWFSLQQLRMPWMQLNKPANQLVTTSVVFPKTIFWDVLINLEGIWPREELGLTLEYRTESRCKTIRSLS